MKDIISQQIKSALMFYKQETAIVTITNDNPAIFVKMNDGAAERIAGEKLVPISLSPMLYKSTYGAILRILFSVGDYESDTYLFTSVTEDVAVAMKLHTSATMDFHICNMSALYMGTKRINIGEGTRYSVLELMTEAARHNFNLHVLNPTLALQEMLDYLDSV